VSSTGRGALLNRLDALDDSERWVICDEADQLREHEVLYDLYEIDGINLGAIANSESDLFSGMDDRLKSRLAVGKRIEFEKHSAAEITGILGKRAEYALWDPLVVSDRQLDWIAERVDGDARKAVRALRETISVASDHRKEQRGFEVQDVDLEKAPRNVVRDLRRKGYEDLRQHRQLPHEILLEEGPPSPGNLYEWYREKAENPWLGGRYGTIS
jgi:Cdc6-like AAA superfamily ATPase